MQKLTRNIFSAVIALIVFSAAAFSQNINGKLGTGGQFIIRDTAATYLSLAQNTGYLSLNRSLVLPLTISSGTGIIFKGSSRFLHDYKGTGTSGENLFLGLNSGNFTLGGTGSEGSYNIAVGSNILSMLTTGYANCGIGSQALMMNTSGYQNTALGRYTMYSNTTGYSNTAMGYQVLYNSTTALQNTAVGTQSMFNNLTGNNNSAFGYYSLYSNQTGIRNIALGFTALYGNVSGNENTAVGNQSLYNLTAGNNNIGIGSDAQVPSNTGSNQVRIGNTLISYAGVQVAWTITSDRKWKENIKSSELGLSFISKLRPVSYFRKNDQGKRTEYGFIAQDVEETLIEAGIKNSGIITKDDNGNYEMRYNDLFAPIVKAIQELQAQNDELKNENAKLSAEIQSLSMLKDKLTRLEETVKELSGVKNVSMTENEK